VCARASDGERKEDVIVSVAGRIQFIRQQGKLMFFDVVGDGAKVQLMSDASHYEDPEKWTDIMRTLRRGDVVGIRGFPGTPLCGSTCYVWKIHEAGTLGKSKRGELSIFPTHLELLSPCFHMIPKNGIKNVETRFRQRYLDLILNPHVRGGVLRVDVTGSV
jgi:lysyl-tRNA synthetase class 2